jgi:cold shock CspA family protein
MENYKMIGSVTFWDARRGYGFISVIKPDGILQQYFFHHSNFKTPPVQLGGVVIFSLGDPVSIGKKVQAVNVRYATQADVQLTETVDIGTDALAGSAA